MMAKYRRILLIFQFFLVITLLIVLSNALSQLAFERGESLHLGDIFLQNFQANDVSPQLGPDSEDFFGWLRVFFWVMLPATVIYAIISPTYRKLWVRTLITIFLLLWLLELFSEQVLTGDQLAALQGAGGAAEEAEFALPEAPSFIMSPPNWLFTLVNLLLGLLFFVMFWYVWRSRQPKADRQSLLVQEVEKALGELEAGGNLKNVVMRCYAEMSKLLGETRNMKRRQAMTPREFERHLAASGLQDEHIQRLTRLFEAVRYGAKPTGADIEGEAKACLTAIIQAYGEAS
jgi:hypothetical protein